MFSFESIAANIANWWWHKDVGYVLSFVMLWFVVWNLLWKSILTETNFIHKEYMNPAYIYMFESNTFFVHHQCISTKIKLFSFRWNFYSFIECFRARNTWQMIGKHQSTAQAQSMDEKRNFPFQSFLSIAFVACHLLSNVVKSFKACFQYFC